MSKRTQNNEPAPDRLPPNSPEAEQAVLGCCLLDPQTCIGEVAAVVTDATAFYDLRNAMIWNHIRDLDANGTAVDVITLYTSLKAAGLDEKVGGLAYLSRLPDTVPLVDNLDYYLDILREKWVLRRMQITCMEYLDSVYEFEGNIEVLVGDVERAIAEAAAPSVRTDVVAIRTLMHQCVERLEQYHRGSPQIKGVTTGLEYVDKVLLGMGGMHGNLIFVAARPGLGKTSLALDICLHAALDYKHYTPKPGTEGENVEWDEHRGVPVGIFSLEMAAESLAERMLFQRARADMQRMRTGFMQQKDIESLLRATTEIGHAKIYIDDTPRCTIDSIRAKARRMHRHEGVRLFVVDYVQLLRSGVRRSREDRVQELNDISGELASLAKELNVPFIVLAQMNRDFEKDPNRPPRLSDLKDCGAFEQDADVVAFLHKPRERDIEADDELLDEVYGSDWSNRPYRVNLLIAKYRYGPSNKSCALLFHGGCTHFEDWISWKKIRGHKAPAAGERAPTLIDPEDVP